MDKPTNLPRSTPPPDSARAALIRQLRDKLKEFKASHHGGWNKKLSILTGMSMPNISHYIKSKSPSLETMIKIATALGLEIRLLTKQQSNLIDAADALANPT